MRGRIEYTARHEVLHGWDAIVVTTSNRGTRPEKARRPAWDHFEFRSAVATRTDISHTWQGPDCLLPGESVERTFVPLPLLAIFPLDFLGPNITRTPFEVRFRLATRFPWFPCRPEYPEFPPDEIGATLDRFGLAARIDRARCLRAVRFPLHISIECEGDAVLHFTTRERPDGSLPERCWFGLTHREMSHLVCACLARMKPPPASRRRR